MRQAGIDADAAFAFMERVHITPVFTAHPTEVARRSVLYKRRRLGALLEELDRIPLPDGELDRLQSAVSAEITALWQTDEVRRASSAGERRGEDGAGLLPRIDLCDRARALRGAGFGVRCRVWTTAFADRAAVDAQLRIVDRRRPGRQSICHTGRDNIGDQQMRGSISSAFYREQVQSLFDLLTTSVQQVDVSAALRNRLESYLVQTSYPATETTERYALEQYRRFLLCVQQRLNKEYGNAGDAEALSRSE